MRKVIFLLCPQQIHYLVCWTACLIAC
jgi:hypothetical protein